MKLVLATMALLVVAMQPGSAAPMCGAGNLSSYLTLSSDGCSLGSSTFTGFELLSLPPSATAIDPMSVGVTPADIAFAPSLTFTINQSAIAGQLFEILFGYRVSGAPVVAQTNSMTGSSAGGGGVVTVVGDTCVGGSFATPPFLDCTGTPFTSILVNDGSFSITSERISFPPTAFLNVVTDIAVDGGPNGTASLTSVTTEFETVPEPASILITAGGLGALLIARLRLKKGENV